MDLLALCDGEISVLRGDTTLHYIVSHWGCSLLEAAAMAASVTTRRMLRIHLSSLLLLFCCFLLWHLLSIQFQLWSLDQGCIGCSFWVLRFVSYGYILPFKFTPIQSLWAWDSRVFYPALVDESLGFIGLDLLLPFGLRCSLGCYLRLLPLQGSLREL